MAIEVYVNQERIELKNDLNIGLTFQIGSILNLNFRAGNLSNKFKVPRTKNNTRILGTLTNVNSASVIPYRLNSGRIVQNGLDLFSDGIAIVESSAKDYSITIYSGNVSFFDLIAGVNVNELNWSSSNHNWTIANIIASFTNNGDYIYPFIEWGNTDQLLTDSTTVNADALLPCLRVKSIFKRMETLTGYSLKGDFIDNNDSYDRMLLTPNNFGLSDAQIENLSGSVTNPNLINANFQGFFPNPTNYYFPFDYQTINFNDWNSGTNEFIPSQNSTGTINVVAAGEIQPVFELTDVVIVLEVFKDGNLIGSDSVSMTLNRGALINPPPAPTEWNLEVELPNGTINQNSAYASRMRLQLTHPFPFSPFSEVRFQTKSSTFSYQANANLRYGYNIDMASLYDWQLIDVVKDIIKQYSLQVQTNDSTKEIFFTRLDDLLKNAGTKKDWSDKINLNTIPTVKYRLKNYGQTNNFLYANDDYNDLPKYGLFQDGDYQIDDQNLPIEKTIVQTKCVGASSVTSVGGEVTPIIPIMETISFPFQGVACRPVLLNQFNKTINFTNSVNSDMGSTTNDIAFCYFNNGQTNPDDQLSFQVLLEQNYQTIQQMTRKTKFVTAVFRLKEIDVYNLDFNIPIFLDVNSPEFTVYGTFYLNKISNFKNNKGTKVELIRL